MEPLTDPTPHETQGGPIPTSTPVTSKDGGSNATRSASDSMTSGGLGKPVG